jgi:hypothetical protein
MDKTAPLPPVRDQKSNWLKTADLARHWELSRLVDRLQSLAG